MNVVDPERHCDLLSGERPRRRGEDYRRSRASATSRGRIGDEIAALCAHLAAATDAHGGWSNGFPSCAAWLSWRVGLASGAAPEHVRVARALGTLPRPAQALARGELSCSKVRELTRMATPETEERLLAVGRAGTARATTSWPSRWKARQHRADVAGAARNDDPHRRLASAETVSESHGGVSVRGTPDRASR
jgi:uncharacterized protein DUF222